jgi:CDK inhibitor PHO81
LYVRLLSHGKVNVTDLALQDLAPALIESIKTAGLVLVSDISDEAQGDISQQALHVARPSSESVPSGVDGYLQGNGVLRFNESIDM